MVRKEYEDKISEAKLEKRAYLSQRNKIKGVYRTTHGETFLDVTIRAIKKHQVVYLDLLGHVKQLENRVLELETKLTALTDGRSHLFGQQDTALTGEVITILMRAKQLLEYEKQVKEYPFNPESYQDLA